MDRCNGRRALPCPGDVGLCGSQTGLAQGVFFRFEGGAPLTKNRFVERVRGALVRAGIETTGYIIRAQLPHWRSDSSGRSGPGGLRNPSPREVV